MGKPLWCANLEAEHDDDNETAEQLSDADRIELRHVHSL